MHSLPLKLSFLLWLTLGFLISSQAAYVTDQLTAGIYARPDADQKALRVIKSATPLEIIKQHDKQHDSWAEVRLPDNSTGWIKKQFLQDDKPASMRLLEAQARINELEQQLTTLRQESHAAASSANPPAASEHSGAGVSPVGSLANREAALQRQIDTMQSAVQQAQQILGSVANTAAAPPSSSFWGREDETLSNLALTIGIAFLLWFLLHWYRSRKAARRFGRWSL